MASQSTVLVFLLFALALSGIELSTSQILKANVSCLQCISHYDLSGIKIAVKCENVKRIATTTTRSKGSFEVKLPSETSRNHQTPLNCLAKLIGGKNQICASRKNMVSKIVKTQKNSHSYTISTPLAFSTTCPKAAGFGSSKTVDLPLPREWGLAPSSYYVPFIPIIGIP
ncbi:hypothetical protein JCGZ_12707 [Jatropha curcas]|uniref:Pollen Ole e 1 allergen and extensin family protein n=1 Tax=Jatropha curcas TaxID=180498 RepID=A0A067KDX0_JATCU|nr:uncharacterized protein LOC105637309 [Jatropha curcas]KDP34426.1 hypothetical protein JCGZ_12707 [Jatropha curcas]